MREMECIIQYASLGVGGQIAGSVFPWSPGVAGAKARLRIISFGTDRTARPRRLRRASWVRQLLAKPPPRGVERRLTKRQAPRGDFSQALPELPRPDRIAIQIARRDRRSS